jgi:signal transduction histidine kinase/CheY-like chemotaxis protein
MHEVRHSLLFRYGLLLILGGGFGWLTIGGVGRFDPFRFLLFGSVWATGLAAVVANRHSQTLARGLFALGSVMVVYVLLRWAPHPAMLGALALVVVANTAVDRWQGVVIAAVASCLTYGFYRLDQATWLTTLILIWAGLALQWLYAGGLLTVLEWSWTAQERAAGLLKDARARRGELAGTLFSLTEATRRIDRTRRELGIARLQAEEARHIKALFAANISHELRTPLNLIIGFSEMMYRTPEVYGEMRWPPALRADVREIYGSACQLMAMIDDILDLSRIDSDRLPLRLEPVELADLVQEATTTVSGLAKGKTVTILARPIPELPTLLVDRARIRQVIINLLNNAVRFTDEGSIEVAATRDEQTCTISVIDTGVGIPEDQLGVIFEEFGQAKGPITSNRGGIGLGLAICRQFVHLHGGTIAAFSVPGQGSTFSFTLPLPGSPGSVSHLSFYAPKGWAPDVPENPMGQTALILAPDARSAQALARVIPGYRCLPITDPHELPAAVQTEHPDGLIVADDPLVPMLPHVTDIWRTAGRPDLPLIRCEVPMSHLVSDRLGIAKYLVKPVQREELLEAIAGRGQEARSFLIVDDDPGFVSLIERVLQTAYPRAMVRKAYGCEEARQLLGREAFDVLLLDLILPDGSGLDLINTLRQGDAPVREHVIITSGSSYPEEIARLRLSSIELLRGDGFREGLTGRYVSALLQVAPPDYTRPAPGAPPPASVAGSPAF